MKRNLFITCSLALLSCAFSAQASSNPWKYYQSGSSYSSPSYTQKYDSTFGMGIKGVYGFGEDGNPNLGGGLLSNHAYIETGDIVHELSLTTGLMSSENKHFSAFDIGRELGYSDAQIQQFLDDNNIINADLKRKLKTSIPLLGGYTLNLPLVQEKAYFFLGGKIGVTLNTWRTTGTVDRKRDGFPPTERIRVGVSERNADFTFSLTAGFRFAIGNKTDLILGYELLKFHEVEPYHLVQAGISWTF